MQYPTRRYLVSVLTGLCIAIAGAATAGVLWAFGPADATDDTVQEFSVQEGWGGGRIASELQQAGLVRWAPAVVVAARLTHTGDALKAGTFLVSSSMTPMDIVRLIASGKALSDDIVLTIPEGMNVWEIDELLRTKGLTTPGLFARTYQDKEGYLFPETYRLPKDAKPADIVSRMTAEFNASPCMLREDDIIIASMLEKEAKTADDMRLVAGIIAKRRELGMPLQIDATVAYGWCLHRWLPMSSTANCDVTQAPIATAIKNDGPYNTYTRSELPAGPISNPGRQACEAAAHPTISDYLYYLSTRDGSQLIYATTLQEHLRNRAKYLGF